VRINTNNARALGVGDNVTIKDLLLRLTRLPPSGGINSLDGRLCHPHLLIYLRAYINHFSVVPIVRRRAFMTKPLCLGLYYLAFVTGPLLLGLYYWAFISGPILQCLCPWAALTTV